MKRRLVLVSAVAIAFSMLLSSCMVKETMLEASETMQEDNVPSCEMSLIDPDSEVRGVWIASVYNIDFPTRPDLTADELRSELDSIIETCRSVGLNTIYFQVRGAADALYESDIFPVSGALSTNGELTMDPLAYLLETAHRNNIRVHAWVNPFRAALKGNDGANSAAGEGATAPIAQKYSDMVVKYADGITYIDPGYPQMRELIANGVKEIVQKYDVDGIIIDDYFYPYPVYDESGIKIAKFDDDVSYAMYGTSLSREDWRRENVNATVKLIYDTVKEIDGECLFGVSPFGVWRNEYSDSIGSDTHGLESYSAVYCDTLAWVDGGYVDYIAPQLVWRFSDTDTAFDTLVRWWNAALDGSGVDLVVSHAGYRYGEGEWSSPEGELKQQVTYARSELCYKGSIFYGYEEIRENTSGAADELIEVFAKSIVYSGANESGARFSITSPTIGAYVDSDHTYIIGTSDPTLSLTLDGKKVGRTKSGCFSVYVPISRGENTFIFKIGDEEREYVIYGGTPSEQPYVDKDYTYLANYTVSAISPSDAITCGSGEYITLLCTAPYGSEVYAVIGDMSVKMYQLDYPSSIPWDGGYAGVRYRADLRLPTASEGEVLDLGELIFTAVSDSRAACASVGKIRVLGSGAAVPIEVTIADAELKIEKYSLYYDDLTVQSVGMTDNAVRQEDGFYLLRCGGWISEASVRELDSKALPLAAVSSAALRNQGDVSEIKFTLDQNVPYNAEVIADELVVTLYGLSERPPNLDIGTNPLISSCEVKDGDREHSFSYYCRLYDCDNFYGFDLRYDDGAAVLTLKNPKTLSENDEKPLDGKRIYIDAGHGGWDNGAAGAYVDGDGLQINEKDINLRIALLLRDKLEALGASVTMTRADDSYVELLERCELLASAQPDISISIHQNSMPYSSDITKIRGAYALYWADAGRSLAEAVSGELADALCRYERMFDRQMLAVCRNPKFPSMLIECGFMTSVEEYEYMLGDGCEKAAEGIADGIIEYYKIQEEFLKNVQ